MPRFLKYYLWSLLIMIIFTYALGWIDIVFNELLTGNIFKDILQSFPYFIEWILPYWWLIIIVGALILALIVLFVRRLFLYARNK